MASQMRMLEKAVSHKTFLITCFRLFRAWHSINMHTRAHTQQTRARQIPMNISLIANGLICLSIEWNHYKLVTKVHAVCSIFKTSSIFYAQILDLPMARTQKYKLTIMFRVLASSKLRHFVGMRQPLMRI